ncbi:hypothetical protein A7982_03842 [Minicystis rosea]|nr:hypothetical protein A7982_03842 [Minicystis rosea]
MSDPSQDLAAAPRDVVPAASRFVRWGYALIGVALFLAYLPTLAPGATFSDGPELVSAIRALGVGHPTGYPIFILVGHAFAALWPRSVPYIVRIEIMNALCGAAGAVFAAHTTRMVTRLAQRPDDDPRAADAAAAATAILLGVAPMLWGQLHIPEVYALHFFLVTWAGYLWMRFEVTRRERYVVAAALPMGLGLAHHVTMVYMLPAALIYLLARRPTFFTAWITTPIQRFIRLLKPSFREGKVFAPWWGFPAACLVGFLPLLSYAYLIWANNHSAGVPWGDVNGWDNLYNHFTGKQYQGFMRKLDWAAHWARIKVVPDIFDQQFLPAGTVLFLAGLVVTFRRALRPALFFFAFLLFNTAHGVHYAVGDYGTYYIPGLYACAVLMGPGLAWMLRVARTRRPESRTPVALALTFATLTITAITIAVYGRFTKRLPGPFGAHSKGIAITLGVVAATALVGAVVLYRKRHALRAAPAWVLPALLGAAVLVPTASAAVARGTDIAGEATIGESYARELGERIPRGSILLTQGDGYLFSMWYASHVLDLGRDFVTLDIANVRTGWFSRYIRTHHPLSCDPLGPEALRDPAAWAARCGTFEDRMKLGDRETWISLDLAGNRRPFPGLAGPDVTPARGADPRCAERAFLDTHGSKECRCWGYGKRAAGQEGMLEEDCVPSAEEHGVVPREPVEIFLQRVLEDYLDERPVFERNVLSRWDGVRDNPRGWDGPSYQRVSATYATVNRGRMNQLVWAEDVDGFDPCAGETLREIPIRASGKPRATPRGQDRRRAYRPNERPMLISSSWLMRAPKAREDQSTRTFGAGEAVLAHVDWFEKFRWDAAKADRRGPAIHHAVRFCVFGPDGRKVATQLMKSGPSQHDPVPLLPAGPHAPGRFRVQACDAGEIGTAPLATAEGRACQRPLLDYDFTVESAPATK